MQTGKKNIWQVLVKEDSDSEYYDYEKSYLVIGTEAQIKKHLVKEYNEFVDLFFDDRKPDQKNFMSSRLRWYRIYYFSSFRFKFRISR